MSVYFDAVLDDRMMPVFNGTPEETKEWIKKNPTIIAEHDLWVCIGKTLRMMTIKAYMEEWLAVAVIAETYERKPMELEAVRITEENIHQVAEWCEGEVVPIVGQRGNALRLHGNKKGVYKPHTVEIGMWVTFNGLTYKCYHDGEFTRLFQKKAS
jgi:hypothetical protein